jgi:hypothetical protein
LNFFTTLAETGAHIGFIRRLVFAEPHIPVDPEHALFGLKVCQAVVNFLHLGQYFRNKIQVIILCRRIPLPVFVKPFFAIVLFKAGQKLYGGGVYHCSILLLGDLQV